MYNCNAFFRSRIQKYVLPYPGRKGKIVGTKILVVDDDANICDLLRLYFTNEGYEVKTALDGVEGVNSFKMYEPDLVLLDIMLPKKDGWQVCREIRESSSKPVIMITAKGEVFDKVLGLELGADDFVVKPFDKSLHECKLSLIQIEVPFEVIAFTGIRFEMKKEMITGQIFNFPEIETELLCFP